MALSTFSGPILWLLMYAREISRKNISISEKLPPYLFSRGIEISFYLSVMILQRHHLFIWTVFSPKLLYIGMAVLVTNVFISIFILCDLKIIQSKK